MQNVFFFIFASYNIFHWIHLLHRISVVLSSVTYRLFSRFYLMFVTIFTATLVHILCGGIYRHFTTFYFAFAAAFTATLVYIFSGSIYRHFSQFYSFSATVFTAALAWCILNSICVLIDWWYKVSFEFGYVHFITGISHSHSYPAFHLVLTILICLTGVFKYCFVCAW